MKQQNAFNSLMEPLRRAVAGEGYTTPTPIQEQAIPHLLQGRDLLACAQTGTGKTAAFVLPLLQELARASKKAPAHCPRSLILTPTRELAAQIGGSIAVYGRYLKISHVVVFGGVSQFPQVKALRRGVDMVVATPGRLLDLVEQGHINLDRIESFVLDEADRMLDMGFIPDVRKVMARLPAKRHSLFFSATIPPAVVELAKDLLTDPVYLNVAPEKFTADRIAQKVVFVDRENKVPLLIDLIKESGMDKILIFTRTKNMADKLVRKLVAAGINVSAIHGGKSQAARARTLDAFKKGKLCALVATDIAARGLDVDGITHVVNYDLPEEPETYVHRIGRTARAGLAGDAVSFCSARERDWLRGVERLIRKSIDVDITSKYHSESASKAVGAAARPEPRSRSPLASRRRVSKRPARNAGHAAGRRRRGFPSRKGSSRKLG